MCSGACGIGFCSSSNFVPSPNTWFITPKWGLILFLYMGSSELWIISPIQGRIIETIYLDIYSPDVSQLFPTILSGKGRKRDKIQIPSSATVLFLRSGVCVGGRWWVCSGRVGEQLQLGLSTCLTPSEKHVFFIFSSFSFLVNPSILFYIISSSRYYAVFSFCLSFPLLLVKKSKQQPGSFSLVGFLLWWDGDLSALEKRSESPLQAARSPPQSASLPLCSTVPCQNFPPPIFLSVLSL